MTRNEKPMSRTDLLKAYLAQLAADSAAAGKFVGVGSDKVEAAARALLSGTGGMLEALFEDVKRAAGDGRSIATAAVASTASRVVEGAIRVGMNKAAEAIASHFDEGARERRKVAKAFMDAAKEMGR